MRQLFLPVVQRSLLFGSGYGMIDVGEPEDLGEGFPRTECPFVWDGRNWRVSRIEKPASAAQSPVVRPVVFLEKPGSFRFSVPVNLGVSCGDYVLLSSADHTYLGRVDSTALDFARNRGTVRTSVVVTSVEMPIILSTGYCTGYGDVLAEVSEETANLEFDRECCVGEVSLEAAPTEVIESYLARAYSNVDPLLPVGTLLAVRKPLRVNLVPDGVKRPTGLFGQSGSGKSFALGIILEELHLRTQVDIIALDPNGDFARLNQSLRALEEINHESNKYVFNQREIDEYALLHDAKKHSTKILSMDPSIEDAEPVAVRLSDLEVRELGLLLGLDPIADGADYRLLSRKLEDLWKDKGSDGTVWDLRALLELEWAADAKLGRSLLDRIDNLGIEYLRIWDKSGGSEALLVDVLSEPDPHTVIVDLSVLTRLERMVVCSVVFRRLWETQTERKRKNVKKPSLLFVDEAHALFPARSMSPEQALTLDWGSRIAGEGRKFGLYLLISSQLPSKIHEHVLTQCGNLVLMKMLSQSDIDALRDSFSFVSEMLLQTSKSFGIGDALVVGGIVPSPCLVHFEGRKTQEGGRDLEVNWAEA